MMRFTKAMRMGTVKTHKIINKDKMIGIMSQVIIQMNSSIIVKVKIVRFQLRSTQSQNKM